MTEANQVVFQPMGRRAPASPENSLLELARRAGVGVEAPCGGQGVCGKCRVRVEGEAPPPGRSEREHLGDAAGDGWRLACQASLPAGGRVWVPEESRPAKQVILTTGHRTELECEPTVRAHQVSAAAATLEAPDAAAARLAAAIPAEEPRAPGGGFLWPLSVLRALPGVLAGSGGRATVCVADGGRVADLAGPEAACLGLAVDLGTTTIVAYLVDLAAAQVLSVQAEMNPQVQYGDDVISRVSRLLAEPGAGAEMAGEAARAVNRLAARACHEAGAEPGRVLECVMVGNTAMHHLFLGLDAGQITTAPYAPVVDGAVELPAREAGLELAPEALLHWLPVKAGFVGADAVAAALAVDAPLLAEPTLVMDLGTNGEMVLAVEGRLYSCSTAAGPAFEGGHIRWGMRGAPGAVEAMEVDRRSLEPRLQVVGGRPPAGICGSGLVSAVAALLQAGALAPTGRLDLELDSPRLRKGSEAEEYVLARAAETATGQDLTLSAKDISELQLAKAALKAGSLVLMEEAGVERLSRVLLAGAFGNYLDPDAARTVGLFPGGPGLAVEGVGNAAGAGALMALTSRRHRQAAQELAAGMRYVELSGHPRFQELFVESMPFGAKG
jgi:uncharacterized 2Fe-2S/4Fe-4S cluster protein (DUF4445 family)